MGWGGAGDSAGAGIIVRLDGREVGVTDAHGMLTISEPAGQYLLEAVLPSLAIGTQDITVTEGQATDATVILDGNREVIEPSDLVLDELVNGGLPLNTSSLTLRFVKNGATVTVSDLYEVELSAADPAFEPKDLTPLFGVTATGAVAAIDASTVTVQLATILSDRSN